MGVPPQGNSPDLVQYNIGGALGMFAVLTT